MIEEARPAPKRKAIPLHVKLAVALAALGVKESQIDWSHEPALGLRAINDAGTDYKPPQLDPAFIFIRPRADHDEITFKDNGTGRGDLTAIAYVKNTAAAQRNHQAVMAAKMSGEQEPEPRTRKKKIQSRGFSDQHRPLRGRNTFQKRK